MEDIQKKFKFNDYSSQLVSEFRKLNLKYKLDNVRNNLFENKEYHNFLGIIQNKYLKSVESDKVISEIISSAIDEKNNFTFRLLNNEYEQKQKTTENLYTYPESFHSNFMSKKVANLLNKNRIYIVNFNYNVCGVKLELGFYAQTKWFDSFGSDKSNKEKSRLYQKIVRIIRRIVFVIEFFRENTCNKNEVLKFDLFLVKPEKKLPKTRLSKLNGEIINSGYTTFYNTSENKKTIIIYRDEELEKLVIHEMIHFFYLDFNQLSIDLSKYLNVNPSLEFIPNESYTEFITIMIHTGIMPIENEFKRGIERSLKGNNCVSVSILNTNNIYTKGIDKKVIFYQSIELLFNEILFGFFQCAKILFQYNITSVKDFFRPYNKQDSKKVFFWQISCILSYFFIKVSLLSSLPTSINFFINNQTHFKIGTHNSVKSEYETLIKRCLENKDYINNIQVALEKITQIIFNKNIQSKITKKCKSHKLNALDKCQTKTKAYYKIRKSLKGKQRKFSTIVLTTRMSLFEL